MKNTYFIHLFRALSSASIVESKMYSVPQLWKGIAPYIRKVISVVYGGTSLVASRARSLHNLITFLKNMNKHHGPAYTVKWLKACSVALQRYLGNDRVASLRDIEPDLPLPRVSRGIPSFVCKADRSRIRRGDPKTVRFWLTAFGLYRVMLCPFVPKLQTITDPFSGDISFLDELVANIANSPVVNRFRVLPGYKD